MDFNEILSPLCSLISVFINRWAQFNQRIAMSFYRNIVEYNLIKFPPTTTPHSSNNEFWAPPHWCFLVQKESRYEILEFEQKRIELPEISLGKSKKVSLSTLFYYQD